MLSSIADRRRQIAKAVIVLAAIGACGLGVWLVLHPQESYNRHLVSAIGLSAAWSLAVGCLSAWLPASLSIRIHAATLIAIPASIATAVAYAWQNYPQAMSWGQVAGLLLAVVIASSTMCIWPVRNLIRLRYRQMLSLKRMEAQPVAPLYEHQYAADDTIDFSADPRMAAAMSKLQPEPVTAQRRRWFASEARERRRRNKRQLQP